MEVLGYQALPEKTFDALETFILANDSGPETKAVELLSLSARRTIGKTITAKNYVGLITMTDGTVIEILPKIADRAITVEETKRVFLEMLKTLKEVTFKDFSTSHIKTDRLNLFEIFIRMFLDEVTTLIKQGLNSAYTPVEENERFFKGKLLTTQNIKHNLMRRERFFVRYDDFNTNRPENRLIKSTLVLLLKQSSDTRNRQTATRLLTYFERVSLSKNHDADFMKCTSDRGLSHYAKALSWCRVFLKGNSFTAFAGSEAAIALLFPMEKIFESFIASKIKHIGYGYDVRTQESHYSLYDKPTPAFALRPDIVLRYGAQTIVMDTKWKRLAHSERNYGISQSDMYQMYAYGKKYDAEKIILLYPLTHRFKDEDISFESIDGVRVEIAFIDLLNTDESVKALLARRCSLCAEQLLPTS
jgi:5-methylcytosine-specific restriction enzyme subunit McrC